MVFVRLFVVNKGLGRNLENNHPTLPLQYTRNAPASAPKVYSPWRPRVAQSLTQRRAQRRHIEFGFSWLNRVVGRVLRTIV
jgi:hypothetical protein